MALTAADVSAAAVASVAAADAVAVALCFTTAVFARLTHFPPA